MNTIIWGQVTKLYENTDLDLISCIDYFDQHGHVISGEDFFVMGMDTGGGWFVHTAAGNLTRIAASMPYFLPWMGWSRETSGHGIVKWYQTHRIMKHIERMVICNFGGGSLPAPPKPPAAPTKDDAAMNLLNQGKKKPPVGFTSTDTGNNTPGTGQKKTLLGD